MSLFTGIKGFEEHEKIYLSLKPKRIRYEVPTYIKFYSIYQYDRLKFRELMNEWLKTDEGENRTYETLLRKQNKILDICYVRDENGKPLRDCDEKHIFRAGILQKVYEMLYAQLGLNPFTESSYEVGGLIVYPDEKQAEIKGTELLSIEERIKLHIRLLKRMRKENV